MRKKEGEGEKIPTFFFFSLTQSYAINGVESENSGEFNPLICVRAQEHTGSQTSQMFEGALQGYGFA